jgi:hypothetical protein
MVSLSVLISSAARKRSVEMEITLPNGAVARAAAPEDEGVVVKLVDGSRYGFVPTLTRNEDAIVAIEIWGR